MRKAAGHSVEIVIIEAGAVSLIFRVNWRHFGRRGGGYGNYRVDLPSVITRDPGLKVATLKSLLCQLPELWILFKHPIPIIQ